MNRTIAIGDIHGCSLALQTLIEAINPKADDTLVLLGDYVDRGIDSKGVLDYIIELKNRCSLIPILGNHDEMMLKARDSEADLQAWMEFGAVSALDSYGGSIHDVPEAHYYFLEQCHSYWESDSHIYLHANYKPELPIAKQDNHTIRWLSMRDYVPPSRHCSGKTVFVGHTPQSKVLDLGYLVDLDTGCCKGGWLTAMDVETRQTCMANEAGIVRNELA